MKEQFMPQSNPETPKPEHGEEFGKDSKELMDAKRDYLESLKRSTQEIFGTDEVPKAIVEEMIEIRKEIKAGIGSHEYLDGIDEATEQKIKNLMSQISHYGQETDQNGELSPEQKELYENLLAYFDSYRLAHNAAQFRNNVREAEDWIVEENKSRKLNFYSDREKESAIVNKVHTKYEQAGFEQQEIKELIKTCNIERLDALEIHEIKILAKVRDVFSKFMSGDKSKYVGLSAALMVPAFIEGYAPMFLSNAFKGDRIDMSQIGLFALLSASSAGGSVLIERRFKKFLDQNFQKEDGFAHHISENVAEFPGDEVGKFGMERIKNRIANAKSSYEEILRTISFDVIPATVTLITSAAMLYQKSPILAGSTAAGTGIMFAIDKYAHRKGKFWEKHRKAEEEAEKTVQKMEELLSAHMEVILSGEKEKFESEIEEMLSEERVAMSDKTFLKVIQGSINRFMGMLNFMLAGMATYLAGGSADKFIASLVYSGNFNDGVSRILSSKRRLLASFRDIVQMETMFNGYAEEEREKEKDRVGMSELSGNDIKLTNVGIEFDRKKLLEGINLEIPGGSLVSLEGLSGAGKTTLLKVLAGYYKPTEGSVQIAGVDLEHVKKSGSDSIYSKIAYLSQFPYLLEDTVRSNLVFGVSGDVTDIEIRDVLKEVGLDERFPNLNERLKGGRGDAGTTSGGETSRIGLARAILKMRKNQSRIVFLDEPTASVDQQTAEKIAEIINSEKANNPETTFISISHDKTFTQKLSTTMSVKMEKGRVSSN